MGNTCSWFGLLRRCASAASQFVCFWVDDADRHVEKAHLPVSVLGFLDGDSFTNESAANVDELASPFDLAVGADLAHHRFGGIIRLWQLRWHGTRRRLVDACGCALGERLMRPLFVVVAHKRRKAASLSGAGCRRWPHGFQKRAGETLVPAVLLRMARIDPFVPDAELDPPRRQRRQAGGSGRGKWRAVVGADHLRQAVLAERALKRRFTLGVSRAARRRHADQITAEAIRHGERFGARAVAQSDPALVINAPNVVGMMRYRELTHAGRRPPPNAPAAKQPGPLGYLPSRRGRWPLHTPLGSLELAHDFARSPGRPLLPQPHNRIHNVLRRRTPMHPRGVRALLQTGRAFQTVALQPFVAGLLTDLVAFAKLRHRPQSSSLIRDEVHSFVHRTALSPRHRLILPADREPVTYPSGLLCYLSIRSAQLVPFSPCGRRWQPKAAG